MTPKQTAEGILDKYPITNVEINQLKQALHDSLLELMPDRSEISSEFSTSSVDRLAFDFAYNSCLDEVIKILNEFFGDDPMQSEIETSLH